MKLLAILLFFILLSDAGAQTTDTLTISYTASKYDSTVFKRLVTYDAEAQVYHVTDLFLSGQKALEGDYLSMDPGVKEEFWNYHHTHVKHGYFRKWHDNGQLEWEGGFDQGRIHGKVTSWYKNGQVHFTGEYRHGMPHGSFTYYHENGTVHYRADFENGSAIRPTMARYDYLTYLPKDYDADVTTQWPAIIYLHGGSSRGSNLIKVKANGIPDRIERGKELPFVVIEPNVRSISGGKRMIGSIPCTARS